MGDRVNLRRRARLPMFLSDLGSDRALVAQDHVNLALAGTTALVGPKHYGVRGRVHKVFGLEIIEVCQKLDIGPTTLCSHKKSVGVTTSRWVSQTVNGCHKQPVGVRTHHTLFSHSTQ